MAERVPLNAPDDLDALLARGEDTQVEVAEPEEETASDAAGAATEEAYEELDEAEVRSLRQKAQMVDRFYSDPAYALQTMQQVAQRLGYTVQPAAQRPAETASAPPAWVSEAATQALAGETDLQFLAPLIAKVAYAITQKELAPLQEQTATREQQARQLEFEQMAQALEAEGADWRDHENEMMSRLTWLKQAVNGGTLSHPRYGSLLKLLYQWTIGESQAQVEAGRRMQRALTNRTTQSQTRAQPPVDVQALIQEKSRPQDKWDVAMQQALAEVRAQLRGG